jgi:hypothetical protein
MTKPVAAARKAGAAYVKYLLLLAFGLGCYLAGFASCYQLALQIIPQEIAKRMASR